MSEPLSEEEEAVVRASHEWETDTCDVARLLATLDQARERIAVLEDEASYLADVAFEVKLGDGDVADRDGDA